MTNLNEYPIVYKVVIALIKVQSLINKPFRNKTNPRSPKTQPINLNPDCPPQRCIAIFMYRVLVIMRVKRYKWFMVRVIRRRKVSFIRFGLIIIVRMIGSI